MEEASSENRWRLDVKSEAGTVANRGLRAYVLQRKSGGVGGGPGARRGMSAYGEIFRIDLRRAAISHGLGRRES